jgi:ABC-2 type transport system permease protein
LSPVNVQHLQAFVWLRYRLGLNQLRRGGVVNSVILALVAGFCAMAAMGLFAGGFLIGLLALRGAPAVARLLVWDGLVLIFLVIWMIGLLVELQRTDGLSLDKFLHLPVSPFGAFLVNYVSSLFSMTLILFLSGMSGLILGQAISAGPMMLAALPLLAAFVVAVTAVTYQFQGWLASLMTNPRRRRTVIVVVTISFILFFQLPNLINIIGPWRNESASPESAHNARLQDLNRSLQEGKLSADDHRRQTEEETKQYLEQVEHSAKQGWATAEQTARLLSTILPPGWLALGAADLAGGSVVPALLGGLGLALIGLFSLARAYRTTLRIYTGRERVRNSTRPSPAPVPADVGDKVLVVEWRLPWVGERGAAVAGAAFRSLLRAPEAKMALIGPVILVFVFGALLLSLKSAPPSSLRPLMAFGTILLGLTCFMHLVSNQFGYDRGGFRNNVLSPIPQREVLLGKNLALAPLALGLVGIMLMALECVCPLRIDHFLAALVQAAAMFLLLCLPANLVSILTPLPIAAGSMKAAQVKLVPVLAQFAMLFAFQVAAAVLLLPVGIELLLVELTGIRILPISLPLVIGLAVGVVFVYRRAITVLGRLLAARQQRVLEIVTSKSE